VEAFVVDHAAVITEQVHAEFEIGIGFDVARHEGVIAAFEEEGREEVDGLALCDVGGGIEKCVVVKRDEVVEIDKQEVGHELFVFDEDFLDAR